MAKYVAKPLTIETWCLADDEPQPSWVSEEAFETLVTYWYYDDSKTMYIVREGEDDKYPFFMDEKYLEKHYEPVVEEKEA